MYREWNALEDREWRRAIVPTQNFPGMFQRHVEMAGGFDDDGVRARLASTAELMEAFAVLAFHSRRSESRATRRRARTRRSTLTRCRWIPTRWEADGLFDGSGLSLAEARQSEAAGLQNLYLETVATPSEPAESTT